MCRVGPPAVHREARPPLQRAQRARREARSFSSAGCANRRLDVEAPPTSSRRWTRFLCSKLKLKLKPKPKVPSIRATLPRHTRGLAQVVEGKCGPENTTKIRVPEAVFRAEFSAGHEGALRMVGSKCAPSVRVCAETPDNGVLGNGDRRVQSRRQRRSSWAASRRPTPRGCRSTRPRPRARRRPCPRAAGRCASTW